MTHVPPRADEHHPDVNKDFSSPPLVPVGLFFGSCQIGPLDLNELKRQSTGRRPKQENELFDESDE